MSETKDFVGNPIRVGDEVIYQPTVYKGLRRGVIENVSKSGKTVDIKGGDAYRPIANVVKVVKE